MGSPGLSTRWGPGRMRWVGSEKDRNERIREGLEVVGAGAAEARDKSRRTGKTG